MLQMAPEFFSHNPKRLIAFLLFCAVLCLVAQSCPTLCDPMNYSLPGCSVYGDSPGKNTGVGCHVLLQGIFPTQGSNPGLLHHRLILYHLSRQGSPFCSPTYSKMQKARLVPFLPQLCNQLFLLWTPFSFFLKKKIIIYFGCSGSSLLCVGFLWLRPGRATFCSPSYCSGVLIAVASLVAEHGLQHISLRCCSTWTQ